MDILEILNMSVDQQAKNADFVCKANAKSLHFVRQQIGGIDENDEAVFKHANATSIANLAFISLHSEDSVMKEKASKIIENFKKWFIKRHRI